MGKVTVTVCCMALIGMVATYRAAAEGGFAKWDGAGLVKENMCIACHGAKVGDQAGIWAKSPHANAFKALGTDAAKEVAKKAGVDNPQTSGKCLKCHSTAYGFTEAKITEEVPVEAGVTCQTCHGPGKDYKMKHNKDLATAKATLGLIVPTAENTCLRCHNKDNPTFKADFDFKASAEKIKHPLVK